MFYNSLYAVQCLANFDSHSEFLVAVCSSETERRLYERVRYIDRVLIFGAQEDGGFSNDLPSKGGLLD